MSDEPAATGADVLRRFVFGDVALDEWKAEADGAGEPWTSFDSARSAFHAGAVDEARQIWFQVAATDGIESRQTLQAWHFLRGTGVEPSAEIAKDVLGVIAEVPVESGHDLLAAYKDGSARYLNYSGSGVVVESGSLEQADAAIAEWIAVGQSLAQMLGPWSEPALPALGAGDMRLTMLTPSGPHFGQGPADVLWNDPKAVPFINAATVLLQLVV